MEGIFDTKFKAVLLFLIFLAGLLILQMVTRAKFKNGQLKYDRVKESMDQKGEYLKELFLKQGAMYPPCAIFIRAFKEEGILELWARQKKHKSFTLIRTYKISCPSGGLGPKRMEGDKQVPEGFYYIDHFNPTSRFYLSLGINYPNESDRVLGVRYNTGCDIFIHGGLSSVGCIPITDDGIKEIYIAAMEAVSSGQDSIPVHIFPRRLDEAGFGELMEKFKDRNDLINFWENIKEGFDIFEKTHSLPGITVGRNGQYIFRS